jgi:hypothetical protein
MVVEDVADPVAEPGPDRVLGCHAEVTLEGSATGGNATMGYAYSWSPAGDVSDPASPTPTTSTTGTYTVTVTSVANGCTDTDTVEVTFDDTPPVAEAGPDKTRTCQEPTVLLEGSASGGHGTAGYAYAWEPAAEVADPEAPATETSTSGIFTLTVTDLANGCTDVDTVLVDDTVDEPAADAGPDQTLDCTAGTVTLTGSASGGNDSAGRTFRWEPAAVVTNPDSAVTDATAAGTYTLTVTDLATGCSDTDTVEVTALQDAPVANAGPDGNIRCDRGFAFLQGSATGGDGRLGYSAEWIPSAGVDNPSSFATRTTVPGTYTLIATDNFTGCRSFDTVFIEQNAIPPVADAGPDGEVTCRDPVALLSGSASGGDGSQGYIYSWEPADDVADPTSAMTTTGLPGTYTLTVIDRANGCEDTDTVVVSGSVEPPVASAGEDQSLTCTVAEVTLNGSASGGDGSLGYAFSWAPASQVSNPFIAQPTTTVAGDYQLTVIDRATGCQATDTVTVDTDERAPSVSAGPDLILGCGQSEVQLEGSATGGNGSEGYQYSWTPAADVSDPTIPDPTVTAPGAYTLTVVDVANGCAESDVVVVTRDENPPVVSAGPDRTLNCVTTTVELSGSAAGGNGSQGFAFSWEPAADVSDPAAATPTTETPGTYTLTVTDLANGCVSSDMVEVSADAEPPVADAGPDRQLDCANPSIVLLGSASGGNGSQGYAYSWEPPDGLSDPGAAQPEATLPGTYTVRVTDLANGCTATDTVEVTSNFQTPVADAGSDRLFDCVVGSAPLVCSASGGDGSQGYEYRWEPAATVLDPNAAVTEALAAGTYTLTVTDKANGCTHADTTQVVSQAAPVVVAGADTTITCARPDARLSGSVTGGDGSAGFVIRWDPADGVADPEALETTTDQPGTYSLVVVDVATGCRAADEVTVSLDTAPPVAEAGPDGRLECDRPTAPLVGSASGGNGSLGYLFRWTPAANVIDPGAPATSATAPGTYTLTVTDLVNGCTDTDTVDVAAAPDLPTADAGPSAELGCGTTTVPLEGSASGGDGSQGYVFRWEPADDVADPDAAVTTTDVPGTYTLTVTDVATGCLSIDAVVIGTAPAPVPIEPSAMDQRPAAAPLTVSWSDPAAPDMLRVAWEDVGAALTYDLHAGTLASLRSATYDHGQVACDLPAASHSLLPAGGSSRYFVAAARNCEGETSSLGRSSLAMERSDADPPCP